MNKQNLFSKYLHNGEEVTARVKIALNYFWNVEEISSVGNYGIIFSTPFYNRFVRGDNEDVKWNSYEWFIVTDNGGELNIEPINHSDRMRSIPYTSNKTTLTAETIAWRIWCVMSNQEIDWNDNTMLGAYQEEPLKIYEIY